MSSEKPLDRRIQKTRKLLLDSLIALILEKGYETVSVQDIIERANVGRSTFYAHFENKEQLLFSGHDLLTQSIQVKNQLNNEGRDFFIELFQHAAGNHHLAKAMLGKGGGDLMIGKVNDLLVAYFKQKIQFRKLDEMKVAIFAAGFASAIVGLLSNWLEANMPFSVDYMAESSHIVCQFFLDFTK